MPYCRTLKLAVLILAAVCLAAPSWAATHNVTVGPDTAFHPPTLTIQTGDTVVWTNAGGTHDLRADDNSFSRGVSGAAWTFSHTFNAAGTAGYHCTVHGAPGIGMFGTITVQGGGGGGEQAGALRFSLGSYSVSEGGGSTNIVVQRINGDDGAVSVQYNAAGGTATAGQDFTAVSGTLNWADNDDSPKSFSVPVLNDTADESNETVILTLSNPTGGAALDDTQNTATLTITDDDVGGGQAGTLRFSLGSYSVGETGGSTNAVVQRINGDDGAVSVQYSAAGGTATAGQDFTAVSGTLNWADNDDSPKSFSVPVLNDATDESNETVLLTLSNPSGGAALDANLKNATLTITDDDPPGGGNEGFLTTPAFPDFRFRLRIFQASGESILGRKEDACLPETLCVSGAIPGRSEAFVRVIGPRPNGFLWPTIVRFTPSRIVVEIQQISTQTTNTYDLAAVPADSDVLPGLQDRQGFLP